MREDTGQNATGLEQRRAASRLLARVGLAGGPWVAVLALAALAIAAAEIALPAVLGGALDAVLGEGDSGPWLLWCALLIAVLVACDTLDDLASGAAIARSTAWLRHALLHHVLALRTHAAERFGSGEVASRIVGNAAEAGRVAPDVVRGVANLIPAIGGIVALGVIDLWLCLTFLTGLPLLIFFVRAFARDATDLAARYFGVQGTISARLVDALSGARTIAAAGTTDRESRRVLAPLPELHRHGMGMWRAQMRISTQDVLVVSLLEIAVLAVAGVLLAHGRISAGELLAATQYVLLASTLGSAVSAITRLTKSLAGAERAAELLAEPKVRYGNARLGWGAGRIELRGVSVLRGEERVLDAIDLQIPGGSLIAVAGESGAGKSVLAGVIGRLLDPDEGEVLLDGVPLQQLEQEELRRAVGYGFERPALLGQTIADAIAFGVDTPPFAELVAAARSARADDFIRRMPEGYQSPLQEALMSGGEIQRVGLARTFAHAGRVMVLDDVAASLDTVTEHHVSRALTDELADRTRIVVAHRASTAARADAVVWLQAGSVRAMAPHRELWTDPDYRSLFQAAVRWNGSELAARVNGGPV